MTTKATKRERKKGQPSKSVIFNQFCNSSQEKAKTHWEDSKDAYDEYTRKRPESTSASQQKYRPTRNFYPLFWSSIKNLLPAYYSRTPNTVAKRLFDSQDPVAKVASQLVERLSKTLLHKYPLDSSMTHASLEFVLTDKATTKIYCEEMVEIKPPSETPIIVNQETGEFLTPDGQIVDVMEVTQKEDGSYVMITQEEAITDYKIEHLPISYDEIIHTPDARNWNEIEKIGFRIYLTRREFIDRFGEEKMRLVSFSANKDDDNYQTPSESDVKMSKDCVELWEIWDKPSKRVSVISLNCKATVIDEYEDPYKLKGFFPCAPFVISSKPRKDLYPTPMYVQLKPMITQLHRLFDRICKLTSALRRRGIADAQLKDVIDQINDGADLEILATKNFQQILERGGIQNAIMYLPLQELSQALQEAQATKAQFEIDLGQLSGIPDVVRGSTDPNETAAAQQQKGTFYNLRTSWDQMQFQEMARYAIEMQVELALLKFDDDMLMKYCGVKYLDPADQEYVPQALQLLRDDTSLDMRVEIETDSMSYMNDKENEALRANAGQLIVNGLQQIVQVQNPSLVPVLLQVLMSSLRTNYIGKDMERTINNAIKKMEEAANQPPPPPPPDYEGQKLQIEMQKLQIMQQDRATKTQIEMQAQELNNFKAQNEAVKQQTEIELKAREQELEVQKLQLDQQYQNSKLQLEGEIARLNYELEAQKVQISATQMQNDAQIKLLESQLQQAEQQFDNFMRGKDIQMKEQQLEVEKTRIELSESEKLMEESRLAQEQQMELIRMQHENNLQAQKMEHEQRLATTKKTKKIKLGKTETGEWEGTSEE